MCVYERERERERESRISFYTIDSCLRPFQGVVLMQKFFKFTAVCIHIEPVMLTYWFYAGMVNNSIYKSNKEKLLDG